MKEGTNGIWPAISQFLEESYFNASLTHKKPEQAITAPADWNCHDVYRVDT
jgi:hypothetical protein